MLKQFNIAKWPIDCALRKFGDKFWNNSTTSSNQAIGVLSPEEKHK